MTIMQIFGIVRTQASGMAEKQPVGGLFRTSHAFEYTDHFLYALEEALRAHELRGGPRRQYAMEMCSRL